MSRFSKRKESRSKTLVQISVLVVILFMTSVFALSHKINKNIVERELVITLENDFDVYHTKQSDPKPEPTIEPPKPQVIISVEDDDEGIENFKFIIENPDDLLATEPAPLVEWKVKEEVFPYVAVQEKPEITKSARSKLSRYIYNNYPPLAKRSGTSGVVTIGFICSKNGKPTNIRIIREIPKDMGFGKIAVQAIKQITFKPGLQRDKPVAVRMQLPIRFSTR